LKFLFAQLGLDDTFEGNEPLHRQTDSATQSAMVQRATKDIDAIRQRCEDVARMLDLDSRAFHANMSLRKLVDVAMGALMKALGGDEEWLGVLGEHTRMMTEGKHLNERKRRFYKHLSAFVTDREGANADVVGYMMRPENQAIEVRFHTPGSDLNDRKKYPIKEVDQKIEELVGATQKEEDDDEKTE
jgi:hypothetical protein